jgi:hypothetical protein
MDGGEEDWCQGLLRNSPVSFPETNSPGKASSASMLKSENKLLTSRRSFVAQMQVRSMSVSPNRHNNSSYFAAQA